jgi:co-chaperonin GroES (HSP10)
MNPSGIEPVDLRVLVLPDPPEEMTSGGIIIPSKAVDQQKYASVKATVVAVGCNAFREWGDAAPKPTPGSRVLIAQYAGTNVKGADDKDYRVINDADTVAILDK